MCRYLPVDVHGKDNKESHEEQSSTKDPSPPENGNDESYHADLHDGSTMGHGSDLNNGYPTAQTEVLRSLEAHSTSYSPGPIPETCHSHSQPITANDTSTIWGSIHSDLDHSRTPREIPISSHHDDDEAGPDEEDDLAHIWGMKETRMNKKKRRALKLKKFHSPCKCKTKIRKNGTLCPHAHHSGVFASDAFVIDREEVEDRSDSEPLFVRSNARIMNEAPTAQPVQPNSSQTRLEEILDFGKQIGIQFHGHEHVVTDALHDQGELPLKS